jgi:hypothetical protein
MNSPAMLTPRQTAQKLEMSYPAVKFATPAIIFGRFGIHNRFALVAGAGFQIAAAHKSS